jgi:hypothetical protein
MLLQWLQFCVYLLLRQDLCPCQTFFHLFVHFEWVYQVSLLDKVISNQEPI